MTGLADRRNGSPPAASPSTSPGFAARLVTLWPFAVVGAFRLWLVASRRRAAWPFNGFDDGLFLGLAGQLAAGRWLGDYDELTLIKGCFYPLWIAVHSFHPASLYLADQLLHLAGAAAMAWAVRPLVPRAGAVALFALLALNPVSFSSQVDLRYLRDGIYVPLTLLVLGAAVGVLVRRRSQPGVIGAWSAAVGLSLAALWLTREEGLWVVPALACAGLCAWLGRPVENRSRALTRAGALLLPLAMLAVASGWVSWLNFSRYGLFATNELKRPEFRAALGALERVEPSDRLRWVPVRISTQRLIAEASPAFREIAKRLRPLPPDNVYRTSLGLGSDPRYEGELMGAWFVWALRKAAAAAGHHRSAPAAMAYYRRLANEVDAACERGALRCGPRRAALAPRPSRDQLRDLPAAAWRGLRLVAGFAQLTDRGWTSAGNRVALERIRGFTGDRLAAPAEGSAPRETPPDSGPGGALRRGLGALYQRAAFWALVLAAAGWLVMALSANGRADPLWQGATVLAVAAATRIALLAWIETSSFHALHLRYLAPAHGPALAFAFCVAAAAWPRALDRLRWPPPAPSRP